VLLSLDEVLLPLDELPLPPLELDPEPVTWSPAGDSAYQAAPNATRPSPFVSPAFLSPSKR
jgi:hypothetical protein